MGSAYMQDSFRGVIWTDDLKPIKDSAAENREKHLEIIILYLYEYVCDSVRISSTYLLHLLKMFIALSRAKHPIKIHVWAGISKRGPTGIYIFEGIMDALLYTEILRKT